MGVLEAEESLVGVPEAEGSLVGVSEAEGSLVGVLEAGGSLAGASEAGGSSAGASAGRAGSWGVDGSWGTAGTWGIEGASGRDGVCGKAAAAPVKVERTLPAVSWRLSCPSCMSSRWCARLSLRMKRSDRESHRGERVVSICRSGIGSSRPERVPTALTVSRPCRRLTKPVSWSVLSAGWPTGMTAGRTELSSALTIEVPGLLLVPALTLS